MTGFTEKLADFVARKGTDALIAEFSLSTETINRWSRGSAQPPERMQKRLVKFIDAVMPAFKATEAKSMKDWNANKPSADKAHDENGRVAITPKPAR